MSKSQSGYTLVELLCVTAILGVLTLTFWGVAGSSFRRWALRAAKWKLQMTLRQAQTRAVMEERNVAVRFRNDDGVWKVAVYADGDGDGVRNRDIVSGVDEIWAPASELAGGLLGVKIGLPNHSLRDPSRRRVDRFGSPVRFNRSSMCSFSGSGNATSGSVFLTNGRDTAIVVVSGETGFVHSMDYDPETHRWVE